MGGSGAARNIQPWQPNWPYPAGFVVTQAGLLYQRNTGGVSGASFAADAANWTALGSSGELGYAEITAGSPASPYINSSAAGGISIPGLAVTVTVGARPISIEVDVAVQIITTNATFGTVFLREDGVEIDYRWFTAPASSQFVSPGVRFSTRRSPSAGSHTYTVYGNTTNTAATWWALGGAASPKSRIAVIQR